jgi:hypothetical protein
MTARRVAYSLALLVALALSCAVGPPGSDGPASPSPPGDDAGIPSAWLTDDAASGGDDASANDQGASTDGSLAEAPQGEASVDASVSTVVSPPDGACSAPLAEGDLVIDELLVESVAGAGDYGEWLEVASTLPCAIDLRGLHGECPSGAKVRTFDVTDDVWLAPGGTFVVADSVDPAIDHDLPGTVIAWSGQPGDVLRNKGGTVSLLLGDALIDSVTFPALKLVVGASVAFPADCPPARRSDWTAWQTSTSSWFPGFFGTPNAANTDVICP